MKILDAVATLLFPKPPDGAIYCPNCGGTGCTSYWTKCPQCHGIGYVEVNRK